MGLRGARTAAFASYIHTPNEMRALSDIEDCIKLTVSALENGIE